VHDNVVEEVNLRSGRKEPHPTPYDFSDLDQTYSSESWSPSKDDLIADVTQLREKWEREGYYHGTGRECLTVIEKELGIPPGKSKIEGDAQREETRRLFKENKSWLKDFRQKKPKSRIQDRLAVFKEENIGV
jgi:hypothetical protein